MSGLIQNPNPRMEALTELCAGLVEGGNGKNLVEKHRGVIDSVTPEETMTVLDILLNKGLPLEQVKAGVGRIINIFFKSLNAFAWEKPAKDHFLFYLMEENREVKKLMNEIREVTKALFGEQNADPHSLTKSLQHLIDRLKDYELHYSKKENILFPYIENTFPQFGCLQIMWAFHDDFRSSIKRISNLLSSPSPDLDQLNRELGKLFFVVLPLIFREEQIIFPVAIKSVPAAEWRKMLQQSGEIGWCYIEQPTIQDTETTISTPSGNSINLGTGQLLVDQLVMMLNTLPVDITFIDENDEVRYFSGGKSRIFPRVNAIIGRKVQNCHPKDSVHQVNRIIHAFRSGEKDHADFWIEQRERFICIRYFAVRDESGSYKGTIEVSQDVSEIRRLEGEQRLLDWEESFSRD